MVKGGVIFSYSFDQPIQFPSNGNITEINLERLLEDIKNDFEGYINELKKTDIKKRVARENSDRMSSILDS